VAIDKRLVLERFQIESRVGEKERHTPLNRICRN
jgi:hypothetical protein